MKQASQKSKDILDQIAIRATHWIGTTNSILIHTAIFIVGFVLYFFGIAIDKILLVITTIVSLEAIYLAIFIQMSVNRNSQRLRKVARDVGEIQEDVDEIQKNVDEIQEDVEEIEKDVDEIQKDVDEIQEEDEKDEKKEIITLTEIESTLEKLMIEIVELKKQKKNLEK